MVLVLDGDRRFRTRGRSETAAHGMWLYAIYVREHTEHTIVNDLGDLVTLGCVRHTWDFQKMICCSQMRFTICIPCGHYLVPHNTTQPSPAFGAKSLAFLGACSFIWHHQLISQLYELWRSCFIDSYASNPEIRFEYININFEFIPG